MNPKIFTLCSTEGDFDLDSQFRFVPGVSLSFTLDQPGMVLVSCRVMFQGDVQIWLMLDGSQVLCWNAEQNFSFPFSAELIRAFYLTAGAHGVEITAKSDNAPGPRDWSPRWDKEGKPFGKLIRSTECPLIITAICPGV